MTPQPGRAHLLPLIRARTTNDSLAYFTTYFRPLSERVFGRKVAAEEAGRATEAKIWEALVSQVWDCFPGFCEMPRDLSAVSLHFLCLRSLGGAMLGSLGGEAPAAKARRVLQVNGKLMHLGSDNTFPHPPYQSLVHPAPPSLLPSQSAVQPRHQHSDNHCQCDCVGRAVEAVWHRPGRRIQKPGLPEDAGKGHGVCAVECLLQVAEGAEGYGWGCHWALGGDHDPGSKYKLPPKPRDVPVRAILCWQCQPKLAV